MDLERNKVVDPLPDRQAETLATWLREHPGVEVIARARARAGAFTDGSREEAPKAVQVADRRHLLRNIGDTLRYVVERRGAALRRAIRDVAADPQVWAAITGVAAAA